MGRFNIFQSNNIFRLLKSKNKTIFSSTGLTLIELLIVISMVAAMFSLLIVLINPFKQIQKARDAQKSQDLKQISYPASLSFGSAWLPYMQKIPKDPDPASSYTYLIDNTQANPQWNVLFAKAGNKTSSSTACALEQLASCTPLNYVQGGYFCVLAGKVDCAVIHGKTLP